MADRGLPQRAALPSRPGSSALAGPGRHRLPRLPLAVVLVLLAAALAGLTAAARRRARIAPPATERSGSTTPAREARPFATPTVEEVRPARPTPSDDQPPAPPADAPAPSRDRRTVRTRALPVVAAGLVVVGLLATAALMGPRTGGTDGSDTPGTVAAPTTTTVVETPSRPDCTRLKCVALTFDDGPSRTTTPALLDILEERGATASFFVVGYAIEGNEDILRRMRRLGMGIENHTWDHPDLTGLSRDGVLRQLDRTDAEIVRASGRRPTYMRPPYGSWTPGTTPTGGKRPVIWENDPQDWLYRNAATVSANVLEQVSPGGVILLHDIHPSSVAAVPAILDGLEKAGYTVATLDDIFAARPSCPVHQYCAPSTAGPRAPATTVRTTLAPEPGIRLVNEEEPA